MIRCFRAKWGLIYRVTKKFSVMSSFRKQKNKTVKRQRKVTHTRKNVKVGNKNHLLENSDVRISSYYKSLQRIKLTYV